MKNLPAYIVVCALLFTLLDAKVIQLTRFTHREWMDWMHAHEKEYSSLVYPAELVICAPAFALKPVFDSGVKAVLLTQEQLESITHTPKPNLFGFYRVVRGEPYQFISWFSWFSIWLMPSILWAWVWNKLWRSNDTH